MIGIGITIYSKLNTYPKYIFLFIGDGMSSTQVELTEIYQNSIEGKETDAQELLSFSKFQTIGLRKNYTKTSYIPDSAASATALSSGALTYNGAINMDMDLKEVDSIAYQLHNQKKKIGIITTVALNHATPAAFYANAESRTDYDKISYDLIESGFEYFAGGSFILNQLSLSNIKNYASEQGYTIIDSESLLQNIDRNTKNIIISPTATREGFLDFAIDNRTEFNLENYVRKGIEVLDNKYGFFIMTESGLIDYAGHNNDARSVISEVEELDKAVEVALEFAKKHPKETLIIVTGDHETGGLTLGNNTVTYSVELGNLQKQRNSYVKLIEYAEQIQTHQIPYELVLRYLQTNYGIVDEDLQEAYERTLAGDTQALREKVLASINQNAGIYYSTTYHTADRISVYAYGASSEKFAGVYDSAEFNDILKDVLHIKNNT